MQTNLNTAPPASARPPTSPAGRTAHEKIEATRSRLRFVSRELEAVEGRALDFETADDLGRALHAALLSLDELAATITI